MKNLLKPKFAALALIACFAFTQTACDQNIVDNARLIVSVTTEVLPIFASAGVNVAKVQKAVDIANKLVTALEQNNSSDAVKLTAALIPVFQEIVSDASLIQNPRTRTLVLATLAAAQIALRYISQKIQTKATDVGMAPAMGASRDGSVISEFAKKEKWRCRSSVTGKFEKMEVCKAHPDTTTVEGY